MPLLSNENLLQNQCLINLKRCTIVTQCAQFRKEERKFAGKRDDKQAGCKYANTQTKVEWKKDIENEGKKN